MEFPGHQSMGHNMVMTPPQLFYPEMGGGQSHVPQPSTPTFDSQYYMENFKSNMDNLNIAHANGNYGGDRSEPIERDYRPQYTGNSATAYRALARKNRFNRDMHARNGLYAPYEGSHYEGSHYEGSRYERSPYEGSPYRGYEGTSFESYSKQRSGYPNVKITDDFFENGGSCW